MSYECWKNHHLPVGYKSSSYNRTDLVCRELISSDPARSPIFDFQMNPCLHYEGRTSLTIQHSFIYQYHVLHIAKPKKRPFLFGFDYLYLVNVTSFKNYLQTLYITMNFVVVEILYITGILIFHVSQQKKIYWRCLKEHLKIGKLAKFESYLGILRRSIPAKSTNFELSFVLKRISLERSLSLQTSVNFWDFAVWKGLPFSLVTSANFKVLLQAVLIKL